MAIRTIPASPGIERWIAAYMAMDEEAKVSHLAFAEASARAHPERKPAQRPALRLVTGGAK